MRRPGTDTPEPGSAASSPMLPRAAKVETASPLLARFEKVESTSPVAPRSSKVTVGAERSLFRKALSSETTPGNAGATVRSNGRGSTPSRRGLGARSATAAVIRLPARDKYGHDATAKLRLQRQDTGIPRLKIPSSRNSVSPRSSISKTLPVQAGETVAKLKRTPMPTSSTKPIQRPAGLIRHNTSVSIRSVPRTSLTHMSEYVRGKASVNDTSTAARRTEAKQYFEVRRREKTFIPEARPRMGTSSLTASASSASHLTSRASIIRTEAFDKKGTSSSKIHKEQEVDKDRHFSKAPPPSRPSQNRLVRLIRRNTDIMDTKYSARRSNQGLKADEGRLSVRRASPVGDQTVKHRPKGKIPAPRRTSADDVATNSSVTAKQTDGGKLRMRLPKMTLSRTDNKSKKPQQENPDVAGRSSRKSNSA